MNEFFSVLIGYLAYYSPIVVVLLWARFTSLTAVGRVLLFYAKLHFAAITSIFLYGFAIDALCVGEAFKGYTKCIIVPLEAANLTLLLQLLALAGLAVFALGVLIYCGAQELRRIISTES